MHHLVREHVLIHAPFPVSAQSGRLVDPGLRVQPQIILQRSDAGICGAHHGQPYEIPILLLIRPMGIVHVFCRKSFALLIQPFVPLYQSLIVVSPRIYHAVLVVAMGQIIRLLSGVEGEFQHLHAGIPAVLQKLHHGGGQEAQILSDDLLLPKSVVQRPEQIHAGPFLPMAVLRRLCPKRYAVIFVKTSEMIDTHHIIQLKAIVQSLAPPLIPSLSMIVPLIKGIAPKLPRLSKGIRRAASHRQRLKLVVKLEHFRMRPRVRRVKSHIDGNISDNLYSALICIGFQLLPLHMELKLNVLIKFYVKIAFPSIIIQCIGPALSDILRPFAPRGPVKPKLHGHEKGIILQPVPILLHKTHKIRIMGYIAAPIGDAQQIETLPVNLPVIGKPWVISKIAGVAFLSRKHALLHQRIQIDKIWIPCKGGKGLVGRVPVACGGKGQNLPVALPRLPQPVDKVIRLFGKTADTVIRRQACHGKQNPTGSLHNIVLLFQFRLSSSSTLRGKNFRPLNHAPLNSSRCFCVPRLFSSFRHTALAALFSSEPF